MKNYKKRSMRISSALLVLAVVAGSCSLDIEETDSIILDESQGTFAGVENVSLFLDNIYNDISSQSETQENLFALQEVPSDELLVPTRGTDWGDNGVWRTLHQHTWDANHPFLLNVWNEKNGAILRCTEVIDPLSQATAQELALGKFARAYNMFWIMEFFGQVPFRDPKDDVNELPTVLTRAQAYDLVVQDLTEAIPDLPASNPTADAENKLRPVQATAQFWLAKVKLNGFIYRGEEPTATNPDWDEVIALVDQIEAAGYDIHTDFFGTFKLYNDDDFDGDTPEVPLTNPDVIWAAKRSTGNRMWNGLHYNQLHTQNGGGGWNGFTTLSEFYDLFEGPNETNAFGGAQEERRGYTQTFGTGGSIDTTNQGFGFGFQFGQMYGYPEGLTEDPEALKDRAGNPLIFTKELPGLTGNTEVTGIRLLKYSPANRAFNPGVVLARFTDAYLMRAEARLWKGENITTTVNDLRSIRGATDLTTVGAAELLAERGRELYIEGWRRNDQIRFGVFDDAWTFKNSNDGFSSLFPIPASAILSNPNFTQNPGY